MVGKLVYPIFIMLILIPVWYAETKSAGQMTEKTTSESDSYIIKHTPGDNFKPYGMHRTVSTTIGREAEIQSGCKSPPGSTLCYTARGIAQAKKPRLSLIKIHNVDPSDNFAYQTI